MPAHRRKGRHRRDLHGDHAERARRKATVEAHIQAYGYMCPGWGKGPHAATDLTADHLVPVGVGGSAHGPLGVLCRSCNGTKQDRTHEPSSLPSVRSRDWLTS